MSDTQLYCVVALSSLSILSGLAMILAYIRLSSLRKPPGMLVLYQSMAQLIIDIHWLFSGVYKKSVGHSEPYLQCRVHGILSTYFFFLSLNYIFCISLEVINKLRSPMENSFRKREVLMHILSHVSCLALVCVLAVRGGTGESVLGPCFIKAGTWADYLMLLPILCYYPFSMIIVIYAFVMYRRTRVLKRRIFLLRFSMVIFLYEICWIPVCFLHVTRSGIISTEPQGFDIVAWIMGSLAGLTGNMIRLFDSAIVNTLKRCLRNQRKEEARISLPGLQHRTTSLLDTEIYKFFQDVFLEGVLSAFLSLSLTFDKISAMHSRSHPSIPEQRLASETRIFYLGRREIESNVFLDHLTKRQCKLSIVHNYEVKVTEYAPELFTRLRDLEGVSCSELFDSFNPTINKPLINKIAGNRGGRSDAFISFSSDKKFLMKTLTRGEKSFLLDELLPVYYTHVLNQYSLLARILGIFSLEDNRKVAYDIIVMVNIIGTTDILTLFDLKGSTIARQELKDASISDVMQLQRGNTYKDLDFLQTVKSVKMSKEDREYLMRTIRGDVEMLTSMNVMDYSFLLAFTPRNTDYLRPRNKKYCFAGEGPHSHYTFYIGIIDYLQVYNRFKRLETLSKTIVNPRKTRMDISAVSPSEYSERFLAFIGQILGLTDAPEPIS